LTAIRKLKSPSGGYSRLIFDRQKLQIHLFISPIFFILDENVDKYEGNLTLMLTYVFTPICMVGFGKNYSQIQQSNNFIYGYKLDVPKVNGRSLSLHRLIFSFFKDTFFSMKHCQVQPCWSSGRGIPL